MNTNEKNPYYSASTDIVNNSPEYTCWTDVIRQAINDIVLFDILEEEIKERNKTNLEPEFLKEEFIEYRESAYEFLFNKNHTISFDDYDIFCVCSSCGEKNKLKMSSFIKAAECKCGEYLSISKLDYEIDVSSLKEVTLKELLAIFNIENIDEFRENLRDRILVLKDKKRIKRIKQKLQREKKKLRSF